MNKQKIISLTVVAAIGLAVLFGSYLAAQSCHLAFWNTDRCQAPIVAADPTVETAGRPSEQVGEPDYLQIISLNIAAPVGFVTESNEATFQVALQDGVVHYPGTALAGELGNVYIFGHSSDYLWAAGDYKTIFARLPSIEVGADIMLSASTGEIFHYTVIETKVVGPKDLSVLDQGDYQKRLLTLQTSYPLGTALQRFIAIAELDESPD